MQPTAPRRPLFSVILYFTFNRFLLSVSEVEKLSSLPKLTAQSDVSISHMTNTADEVKPQDKLNTKERSSSGRINTVGEANTLTRPTGGYNYINIYFNNIFNFILAIVLCSVVSSWFHFIQSQYNVHVY